MDINTFKEAQSLVNKINDADRKLAYINSMFEKDKELYIGDGSGRKFEISNELELKIKHLIKEDYWSELTSLNEKLKTL